MNCTLMIAYIDNIDSSVNSNVSLLLCDLEKHFYTRRMGNSAGKTAVKRMASSTGQTPLKVTNKHFVLGSPIQGPFPDGMEKVVVGTGKS